VGNFVILTPQPMASIAASRGTGQDNLHTPDAMEVWQDSAVGSPATIDFDLGYAQPIDTIFLGAIYASAPGSTWSISGGTNNPTEFTIAATAPLRVPETPLRYSPKSAALWRGAAVTARYVRVTITQPAGWAAIAIGIVAMGSSSVPFYNQEWGAGRTVKDTGSVTRLPSGSAAIVEGARYASYSWTLGDLTDLETEYLFDLQAERGEGRPVLVIEDDRRTDGLLNRLHYGLLANLRPFEKRGVQENRWDVTVDDLIPK